MPQKTKLYHRGNNDAREPNTLTAVMIVELDVNAGGCLTRGPVPWPVADFGAKQGEGVIPIQRKATKRKADDERVCEGDVMVRLKVDFSSPMVTGNGEAQAGDIAAQFGLEHNGSFENFDGGPLAPRSEFWRVTRTIQVGVIPCIGNLLGKLSGTVKVNFGAGTPAAYFVAYEVQVEPCGSATHYDIQLIQGTSPRGIDEGGRTKDILKEVQFRDPLGYPLRNPPPTPMSTGSGGQPTYGPV